MKLTLGELAEMLDLSPLPDAAASVTATGWSVDSRTLQPGDVYFALRGPNHDGHAFVAECFAKGAVAAVVDREVDAAGAMFKVADVLEAMQRLATRARVKWNGEVVAVTGSAGKTTTKGVIAEMLAEGMQTAKNEGNLNNHVGVPLTLLRLPETARAAVIEMGMNHAGEIRALAQIARPQIGIVTNVGHAHIENFDSIEGVAAAKRELIESLGPSGIAVLNADDTRVAGFARSHAGRSVLYGQSSAADVRAEDVEYSLDGVRFRVGPTRFESALAGRHNVSNILAGRERVRNLRPGKMRGERLSVRGILVYNDCYNSNPDAARAMLDVLRDTPAARRIAVLGEMLELGRWAEPLHRDLGNYVAANGIDVLVGIRGAACHMTDAVKRSGLRSAAYFFEDPAEAGRLVRSLAAPGDAILFKGSRGVRVEKALEQFLDETDPSSHGGGS